MPSGVGGDECISARIRISGPKGRCSIAVVRSPRSRPEPYLRPTRASFNANGKDRGFLILALMGDEWDAKKRSPLKTILSTELIF
jgi:hypothetical protein